MPNKITIDDKSPTFDTADQAASALSESLKTSKRQEKAGVLYASSDGKYKYSTTINGDHDNFALSATVPPGYKLAGIVHSHLGNDKEAQVFSPNDLQTADRLKLPSYVNFMDSGSTRKYTPGKTALQDMKLPGSSFPMKVSSGDELDLSPPKPVTPSPQPTTIAPSSPPVTSRDSDITHYLFT